MYTNVELNRKSNKSNFFMTMNRDYKPDSSFGICGSRVLLPLPAATELLCLSSVAAGSPCRELGSCPDRGPGYQDTSTTSAPEHDVAKLFFADLKWPHSYGSILWQHTNLKCDKIQE